MASDYPTTPLSDWGDQKAPGATRLDLIILLALSLGASAGSYRYQIHHLAPPGGPEPSNQSSIEWKSRTRHSFFWGLVRQDLVVENCSQDDGGRAGSEEINVGSNLAFAVLTGATFGLWSPVKVSWRCAEAAARLESSDHPTDRLSDQDHTGGIGQ